MRTNSIRLSFWLVPFLATSLVAASDRELADAAKQQDRETVRALLKQVADVNQSQPDGATALHWAAHWNDLETADLLLRAGASVNTATSQGVTPLALASENGSAAMVEKLLTAGANANAADASGQTPLMIAARTGTVNAVKALLAHGATVSAASRGLGQTALMWALSEGHLDIVKVLVAANADVRAQSKRGYTPLMFAAQQGDMEAARILIAAGANVNQTTVDGTHALPLAIANGHVPFALYLLEQGANANGTITGEGVGCRFCNGAADGITALHVAVDGGGSYLRARGLTSQDRRELVKALLAHGADPNARANAIGGITFGHDPKNGVRDHFAVGVGTRRGATPFWLAANSADVDVMRVLLEGGADPKLTPECRSTPLMVAAGLGQAQYIISTRPHQQSRMREAFYKAVRFLVEEVGADINAVNDGGFTALHGAAFAGNDAVVQFLVDRGANLNKQDWKGRTPFRIAQGAQVVNNFRKWTGTAELFRKLGADTTLGEDGEITARESGKARGEK